MNKLVTALIASAFVIPFTAFANEATTLNVEEKIEVNAPASAVWFNLHSFGDMGAWHPAVKKTEIVEGYNNKAGAVRLLTLQDGSTIKERLLDYKFKEKNYEYEIIEGVLPVSNYVSTLTVTEAKDGKSLIVWKGNFKRKDLSDNPAAGQSDDDAVKTVTGVYKGGLENLKKIAEGK
ncbi:MAG: SRPBCC family protein [Methylotenera sp.]